MATSLDSVFGGDDRDALVKKVEAACVECRRESKRLEIEVRSTPDGCSSRQDDVLRVDPEQDPRAIVAGVQRKVFESYGETFVGEIRFNFRPEGDTQARLGSWSRQVEPPRRTMPTPAPAGGFTQEDVARLVRHVGDLAHTATELGRAQAQMMLGAAHLVREARGLPPAAANDANGLLLIGQALSAAAQGGTASAAQAGAHAIVSAAQATQRRGPAVPLPPGVELPRTLAPPAPDGRALTPALGGGADDGGTSISEAQAEQWARANPAQARAMAMRLLAEGAG